jgi:hypothetical protein
MKDKIIEILKSYKESIIDDSSRLPEYAVMEYDFNDLAEELEILFSTYNINNYRGAIPYDSLSDSFKDIIDKIK